MTATAELSFRLRQALSWSPVPSLDPPLRLSTIRTDMSPRAIARLDELEHRYDLEPLTRSSSLTGAREAFWALNTLDTVIGNATLPIGRCLDVGAKNATHLPGQATFRPGPWDLVEVDAHRRYIDLTTRGAHGRAMAARFRGTRYLPLDVRNLMGRYSVITWFLPFVVEQPHESWGLPRSLFAPAETLAHVLGLLDVGGALVIVNQSEAEADVQRRLLADVAGDLEVTDHGPLSMVGSPYRHERHAFVVRRR